LGCIRGLVYGPDGSTPRLLSKRSDGEGRRMGKSGRRMKSGVRRSIVFFCTKHMGGNDDHACSMYALVVINSTRSLFDVMASAARACKNSRLTVSVPVAVPDPL
jgi:hypothetical protein